MAKSKKKPVYDVISVGDATLDVFVDLIEASVHCNLRQEECQLCLSYADKIPVEKVQRVIGGNAANNAVGLLHAAGGRIVHLDLTLICEAPRIGPHRQAMVDSIARIAGIESGRVSVKATTTEGLGFTGRREGIAAQAVVAAATGQGVVADRADQGVVSGITIKRI